MTFEETTKEAAKKAHTAASAAMRHMRDRYVHDEDDVTGALLGRLLAAFDDKIGGVNLSASILRHRKGVAAEEGRIGANLLIHVSMDTPTQKYSKGVLVQAKKQSSSDYWSAKARLELTGQCEKMLAVTPSAFVFDYDERGVRCGAATRIAGAVGVQSLRSLCGWTSYRFFLELFRCPIGDPRITSAIVDTLPVPNVLSVNMSGEFTLEEGSSLR